MRKSLLIFIPLLLAWQATLHGEVVRVTPRAEDIYVGDAPWLICTEGTGPYRQANLVPTVMIGDPSSLVKVQASAGNRIHLLSQPITIRQRARVRARLVATSSTELWSGSLLSRWDGGRETMEEFGGSSGDTILVTGTLLLSHSNQRLDIAFGDNVREVEVLSLHISRDDEGAAPLYPPSFIAPQRVVVVRSADVVLQRRTVAGIPPQPARYSLLDEWDRIVAEGTLTGERQFDSLSLPVGWYRVRTSSISGTPWSGESAFAVVPDTAGRSPDPASRFGIHVFGSPEGLTTLRLLGAGWVRWHGTDLLKWKSVQPSPDRWRWRDEVVDWFREAGVTMVGVLGQTPNWASSDPDAKSYPYRSYYYGPAAHAPRSMEEWRQYVGGVSQRYGAAITNWEVWNEPDIHFLVADSAGGKNPIYRNLLLAARTELGPKAHLLAPTTAYTLSTDRVPNDGKRFPKESFQLYRDSRFLERFLAQDAWLSYDVFSFHEYARADLGETEIEEWIAKFTSLQERVKASKPEVTEFWQTEYNVMGRETGFDVAQRVHLASLMVRGQLALFSAGVDKIFTYDANEPVYEELYATPFSNFFYLSSPSPRYSAYAVMTSLMGEGGTIRREVGSGMGGEKYYIHRSSGGEVLALYSDRTVLEFTAEVSTLALLATGRSARLAPGERFTVPRGWLAWFVKTEE